VLALTIIWRLFSQVLHAIVSFLDPELENPAWIVWLPENLQGYFIVLVLGVSGSIQTAVLHQYFYRVFNVGKCI
jgi:hypothetical protein